MKVTFTDVPLSHFSGRGEDGGRVLIQTKQGKRIMAMVGRALKLGGSVQMETTVDPGCTPTPANGWLPGYAGRVYERITATIDTTPETDQ